MRRTIAQDGGGVQSERVATAKMIATTVSELDWLGVGEREQLTATVVPSGVNGSGDDNNYLWQQSSGQGRAQHGGKQPCTRANATVPLDFRLGHSPQACQALFPAGN